MNEDEAKKKSIDSMLQDAAIEKFGLKPVMEKIEKVMPLLEQVAAGAEVLKGQDGKTPELGVDYLTEEQQQAALEMVRPQKGRDYNDGEPGKDGYTPVRGIDYMSDEEMADIVSQVTPKKGKDYFTQDEIAQIKVAVTPKKGVDYNDGANPTVEQFIDVVKGLKGKDMASFSQAVGAKIDISHVKNAGQFIFNGKKYGTEELMHGSGATGGGGTPGGSIHDVQLNDGAGGFSGSDSLMFANGYLTINGDSSYGQINLTNSPATSQYGGLGINGANDQITVGALKGDLSIWNGQAINFSADSGGTNMVSVNTDGTFTIGEYTLPATDGSNDQVLQTDGAGNVSWATVSGGGTSPGGLNTQIQYNNSGSFGGITGATTDGTVVSLNGAHLLNPTINGAGAGLATLVYPNTASNATITVPATTGTLALTSDLTGYVTSVSGTSNRVTSTGGTTPVIDISASYVGQSSITTLGTITTGVWSGTTIAVAKGGTGVTTIAAKSIWLANSADTITSVTPGASQSIRINSGNTAWEAYTPAVGTVTSVSGTSNRISSTGGATPVIDIDAAYVGQASITTLGTIATGTWSATTIALNKGGTGQTTKAAAFDALSPMSASGDIIYGGTAGTGTRLAKGSDTQILTLVSGLPAWAAPATAGTVTSVSGTSNRITSTGGTTPVIDISSSYVGQSSITTLGTITTGVWTGTTIAIANGGTGATSLAAASIPTYTSTNTFTNKRMTRRAATTNAPGATPSTNTDNVDVQIFTGLGTAITSMTTNLSGTPVNTDFLEYQFVDDGTPRAITWGTGFANGGLVNLPSTTVASTMLRVLLEYQTVASLNKWVCVAVA